MQCRGDCLERGMHMMQQHAMKKPGGGNWVRKAEHAIVRIGSLALSIVSGHAVYWFFSAMDGGDAIEPYMTWGTAAAIGLLGYVILRALTHRLLHKEKVYVYIPLCFILMGVETVSNFMKAVVGVHNDHWLVFCPASLVQPMTYATYVVLSIMPAFTVFLAYVDMDLERAKQGVGAMVSAFAGNKASVATPVAPNSALKPVQPMSKTVPANQYSAVTNGQTPFPSIAPYPTMASAQTQAYAPVPVPQQQQGGVFGGLMNNIGRFAGGANAQQQVQQP